MNEQYRRIRADFPDLIIENCASGALHCGRELEKGERICPSCRTPKGKRAPEKRLSETLSAPASIRDGTMILKKRKFR